MNRIHINTLKARAASVIEHAQARTAPYDLWKVLMITGGVVAVLGFLFSVILTALGIILFLVGFGVSCKEAYAIRGAEKETEAPESEALDG